MDGPWERRLLLLLVLAAALVRFWGLDAVGLHAPDEDTVALPAIHLASHGEPLFPSGMYYARAIVQTYLIAGSIKAFGVSEWAMRLPSAICGVLLVVLSYFLGRRFLRPIWNLAFVASVAFLPELVMQSQNSRMYIFLVTCIAAYMMLIFAWEKSNRSVFLVAAVAMLLLGMQFQALMIFAALMLFYPGLLQADSRKLGMAAVALALSLAGYWLITKWTMSFYIAGDKQQISDILNVVPALAGESTAWRHTPPIWYLALAALTAGTVSWLVARQVQVPAGRAVAGALLLLGLGSQFLLNYHIAMVLLVAGTVLAVRNRLATTLPLWVLGAVCMILTTCHIAWLNVIDIGTRGIILEAMMGRASIWSFVNYIAVSPAAVTLVTIGGALALWRVARGQSIADTWLLALLGVWAPLFLIGCFDVDPEFRYMTPVLLPLLIAAFATCQWIIGLASGTTGPRLRPVSQALAASAAILIVNPVAFVRTVNAAYDIYPDHKGAAEYIRTLHLANDDILIAEDVITQTYYLGRVDYWLTDVDNALKFGYVTAGDVRDVYTDTRIIATPGQLTSLLKEAHRGDLYIVGSGENFVRGHRWQRGTVIDRILKELGVVYEGRDGLTTVWKVPPPGRD